MTKPKTVEEAASELLRGIAHWRNIARRNLPAWLDKYVVALFEALEAPPVAPGRPPCPNCEMPMKLANENWECCNAECFNFAVYHPGDPLIPIGKPAAGAAGLDGDK